MGYQDSKEFNFISAIFGKHNPSSPGRKELASNFLREKLGQETFKQISEVLHTLLDKMEVNLDQQRQSSKGQPMFEQKGSKLEKFNLLEIGDLNFSRNDRSKKLPMTPFDIRADNLMRRGPIRANKNKEFLLTPMSLQEYKTQDELDEANERLSEQQENKIDSDPYCQEFLETVSRILGKQFFGLMPVIQFLYLSEKNNILKVRAAKSQQ